jgi:hypothetical protein
MGFEVTSRVVCPEAPQALPERLDADSAQIVGLFLLALLTDWLTGVVVVNHLFRRVHALASLDDQRVIVVVEQLATLFLGQLSPVEIPPHQVLPSEQSLLMRLLLSLLLAVMPARHVLLLYTLQFS